MEIQIKSRYGDIRTFEEVKDVGYIVYGESHYLRCIGNNSLEAIDFEGGPYISVGMDISYFSKELKGTVDKIEFVKSSDKPNCYLLTIKNED